MIEERYRMNFHTIHPGEMELLKDAKICVVGCGGLGGYVIEMLARLGIGRLVVVDGDVFHESNLNRQLLCTESTLGRGKAEEAAARGRQINSTIEILPRPVYMDRENAGDLLSGCSLAIDALDSIDCRLLLEEACSAEHIPLIHGAIGGWYGQVAVVMPGSGLLKKLYAGKTEKGEEAFLGNPPFIPAHIASIQVAECVKILLNRGSPLINAVLEVDLLSGSFDIISL